MRIENTSQTKHMKSSHEAINIGPGAGWRDLPRGGVIPEGGTAQRFATGDWRTLRPIWSAEKCIHCHRCWVYCPDMAVISEDGKIQGMDYKFCKGCGICANVCPTKVHAIEMHPEDKFVDDEAMKQEDEVIQEDEPRPKEDG